MTTRADLLTLYEDLDALIDVTLASPTRARRIDLAYGVVAKLAELTRRIAELSEHDPDLVDALERGAAAAKV